MIVCQQQLDEKQISILNQFRDAVRHCKLNDSSDEFLTRWLTAQDFNIDRAEKMLKQSVEWRRINKVDAIVETCTPSEVIDKYFSIGEMGVDKYGCPVFVLALGRTDLKGLLQCVTKKEFVTHMILLFEKMTQRIIAERINNKTKKLVWQLTLFIDMDQFSMKEMMYRPAIEAILEIVKIFVTHYPDTFRRAFIINAPKIFSLLFGMVKPFLHRVDVPKFKIFGSDQIDWAPAVLEEIEADQLFAYYGGTQTDSDGDPKCLSKWNMGGKIPYSYYLNNKLPVPKDYMETSTIIAGAGGRKKIKYITEVPYSIIRWEFMTEGGDIGFHVYSKDSNGNKIELIPFARVESHLVMEEGEITCDQPGKFVVEFDNTFSYLKPKKLRYHVGVVLPSSQ